MLGLSGAWPLLLLVDKLGFAHHQVVEVPCTINVGYIGGTPDHDPYRRGFDFFVDHGNDLAEKSPNLGFEGNPYFAYYYFYYFYFFESDAEQCGGITAYHAIASTNPSDAEGLVEEWHGLGMHFVIIGAEHKESGAYRRELGRHSINHFSVNVTDWIVFRTEATDWTWGVGNSHLELGKQFAALTARESQKGLCVLLPDCKCLYHGYTNVEYEAWEAIKQAAHYARELGVDTVYKADHTMKYYDDFNGTVEYLKSFAQGVVASGCDVLMAFVRDSVGAALLQTELAAVNAPLMAEFFLPELPESEWAMLGRIGEHVYTASRWHQTINFECPVFGNTSNFVDLYEEWEEQNYGVVRSPGVEEASAVAAGVLIWLARFEPALEGPLHFEGVPEEELYSIHIRKVLKATQESTFYGDVHFDGQGVNFGQTPVTLQYFENGAKYVVRPKEATLRAAILPMDSFESRESADESLPGCPPGTKLIPRIDDGWTLRGMLCQACEPLEYQDEYNQTDCKTCIDGEVSGVGDASCTPCSPGYFRGPEMASCALCADGESANTSGATKCERCSPGSVVQGNSTSCTPCPPGFYSGPWDTECSKCNWGEFTDGHGATSCERCPPGRFASAEGQSRCEGCQAGHVAPAPGGQRECQPCPMGFSTEGGNESHTCEPCDNGFYSNETGSPTCRRCPETFGTERIASDSHEKCACPPGSYWHKESPNSEPTCQTRHCGSGLLCRHWSNDPPTVAAGFSGGEQLFEGAEPIFLVRCGGVQECPGGLELGECPVGHQDKRACAECEEGHSKARSGECVECQAMPFYAPILACLAVLAVVAIFCHGLHYQEIDVESEAAIKVTAIAGILLTSLQILGVFRYIGIDWPEPIQTFHAGIALLLQPIDLFKLDCILSISAAFESYALVILMWPVFAIFIFLMFKTASCLYHSDDNKINNNTIFQIECVLVLVFYTSISMLSLAPWQCEENPDLTASVVAYRQVICWNGGEHTGMILLSCAAIDIFVVGFLSLIAWATYVYPWQVTRPDGVKFLVRYRWIFHRFKPERHYHGLIYCIRNLVVTLLPVIFANNIPLQFLLVGTTLLVSLMLQCWLKPWKTEIANKFDAACTTLLVLTLVVGSLLLRPDEGDVVLIVQVFFSTTFALIGLAFIYVAGYNIHLRLTHRKRFVAFLCHHKVAAAVLARWVKIELKLRCPGRQVFLDSDELSRLDTLFEVVGFQTQNFVVLLTKETLKRIWCAGEITTALQQGLNIICIACNDYEEPTDDFIENLDTVWSDTQISEVARQGVSLPRIKEAFRQFRALPKIALDRNASYHEQARLIDRVLQKCTGIGTRKITPGAGEQKRGMSFEARASEESNEATLACGAAGHQQSNEGSAGPLPIPMADAHNNFDGAATATERPQGDVDDVDADSLTSLPPPNMQGPSAADLQQAVNEISSQSIKSKQSKRFAQKRSTASRVAGMVHSFDTWRRTASGFKPTAESNLMVGNFADPEAAMVCRVIQLQLQKVLQTGIPLCSREISEALEQFRSQHPHCLVAVLTRGILSRPEFAVLLAKACSLSQPPALVPIVADYAFVFPDASFYGELGNGQVFEQTTLEDHGVSIVDVERAYKSLFNVISKRFSSHGSEKIQLTEVQEMANVVGDFTHTQTGESTAPSNSPS